MVPVEIHFCDWKSGIHYKAFRYEIPAIDLFIVDIYKEYAQKEENWQSPHLDIVL